MTDLNRFPPAEPVHLLLVRHGESEWNVEGRWQGQADPALSPEGERQAERAGHALAGLAPGWIVSSDLRRALRTAELIAGRVGAPEVEVEPGLREIDVGQWQGLTRPEIEARWPGLISDWRAGRLESTPGGETLGALRARMAATVHRIVEMARARGAHGSGPILVVTHRRAMSALEEALGARPVRPRNLAGRRFLSAQAGHLEVGEPIDLLAPADRSA